MCTIQHRRTHLPLLGLVLHGGHFGWGLAMAEVVPLDTLLRASACSKSVLNGELLYFDMFWGQQPPYDGPNHPGVLQPLPPYMFA